MGVSDERREAVGDGDEWRVRRGWSGLIVIHSVGNGRPVNYCRDFLDLLCEQYTETRLCKKKKQYGSCRH